MRREKIACHSPVQFAVFATLWSTLVGQFRRQAERASHQAGHAGTAAKGLAGRFLGSPAKRRVDPIHGRQRRQGLERAGAGDQELAEILAEGRRELVSVASPGCPRATERVGPARPDDGRLLAAGPVKGLSLQRKSSKTD